MGFRHTIKSMKNFNEMLHNPKFIKELKDVPIFYYHAWLQHSLEQRSVDDTIKLYISLDLPISKLHNTLMARRIINNCKFYVGSKRWSYDTVQSFLKVNKLDLQYQLHFNMTNLDDVTQYSDDIKLIMLSNLFNISKEEIKNKYPSPKVGQLLLNGGYEKKDLIGHVLFGSDFKLYCGMKCDMSDSIVYFHKHNIEIKYEYLKIPKNSVQFLNK